MKAQNKYAILCLEQQKSKSKIVLAGVKEEFFTIVDSEEYKKGDKVLCFEFPQLYEVGGKEYYITKNENICAKLA